MKKRFLAAAICGVMALSLCACGTKYVESTEAAQEVGEALDKLSEELGEALEDMVDEAPASDETIIVEFEDMDGIQDLMKRASNFEIDGATVEIDGVVSKTSGYSVGEKVDGTYYGLSFTWDGEYPADGAHVKIVGTIVAEGLAHHIEASSLEVLD